MSRLRQPTRRQFLAFAGATTVLSRAAGTAFGEEPAKAAAPSDRIRIALLGAGGQGQADTKRALEVPGVELVAAADVYDGRFEECREKFGKDVQVTRDYREVLARKDVDAVIVASPDHWHTRMTVDALEAGKDVYCEKPLVHSVDELSMLVGETEEAGIIPSDQASYVRNVFELSDKKVRDAMVPREKVVTLSLAASEDEVLEIARETAHTRMPVWEDQPDNIVGIVNTKDLFHLFSLKGLVILMDAMYPPLFVSPDQSVAGLLRIFRRERRPMAVVREPTGRFLGIITLEDVLEEIVGEIEDEHDVAMPHGTVGVAGGRPRTPGKGGSPTAS